MLVLLIFYFGKLILTPSDQLWILFGSGDKSRSILVHKLSQKLGEKITKSLLQAHILSGCDVTSKFGTKAAAIKHITEELSEFGTFDTPSYNSFRQAEKYLRKLLNVKADCETFDDLRYYLYMNRSKSMSELPPSSASLHGHLLRSFYFVRVNASLLQSPDKKLNPSQFGWQQIDSILVPEKLMIDMPDEYTTTCGFKKLCNVRCKCQKLNVSCTEYCQCDGKCTNKDES